MSDNLRIVDAPDLPYEELTDDVKIPTGGKGNYSVKTKDLVNYTVETKDLANKSDVQTSSNGVKALLEAHKSDKSNPHGVTKDQVGLGDVNNTADLDKPVSSATQAAIISANQGKADKTYVDIELGKKANSQDVTNSLNTKEDKTFVTNLRKLGGVDYWDEGVYPLNGEVRLDNGGIVKSTVANNTKNPNLDMTGWVIADASLNSQKLQRENVSVWDFFTKAELSAYKASPTTFDAYRPIQEFFTYIALNDVGTAYCSITACVSQGLLMGVQGVHKTLVVNGNMQLTALNAIDTMIQREIGQDFEWVGFIYLIGHRLAGSPSYTYRLRTCRVGVGSSEVYNNARQKWGGLRFMYFQQHGLQVRGATTASQYKYVRANVCGAGLYNDSRYRFETTFNNRVDTGTSGSATQRTTITVSELPSADILQDQSQSYIVVNNEPYVITAYDIAASTITVTPWIDLTVTSGTLAYMIGGGVDLRGGDSSAVQFGYVEGTNCGIMFNDCALYTANIGMLMAQANGCGYNVGSEMGAATIGGTLDSMYIEGNHINLMFTSTGTFEKVIGNTYALDLAKVKVMALRLNTNTYAARTLGNGRLTSSGITYTAYGAPNNAASNVTTIDIFDRRNLGYTYRHNNIVFAMPVIDTHKNSLTGLDNTFVKVIGTAASSIPTTVTFRPASGCTVNGSTSDVVFSGFTTPPQFDIYAHISTGNYIVMCKDIQKGVATATYDPPSLPALGTEGDSVTTTVPLTGAVVGNIVQAAFSQYNAGVEINAVVSSANTVTVKFKNTTVAPIDLPSGTLTVKLI